MEQGVRFLVGPFQLGVFCDALVLCFASFSGCALCLEQEKSIQNLDDFKYVFFSRVYLEK